MREVSKKTRGEIEAAISAGIIRYEQEYLGRGPKKIHTHLIGNHVVVIVQGILTSAERHLVQSVSPAQGKVLVKQLQRVVPSTALAEVLRAQGRVLVKQVQRELLETGRAILEEMVREVTGAKVLSMHHDISTVSGEKIVVFTLAQAPDVREAKQQ